MSLTDFEALKERYSVNVAPLKASRPKHLEAQIKAKAALQDTLEQ